MRILTINSIHLLGPHMSAFKFWRTQDRLYVKMFLYGNKINFYSSNH
jgi:hypothetical protein